MEFKNLAFLRTAQLEKLYQECHFLNFDTLSVLENIPKEKTHLPMANTEKKNSRLKNCDHPVKIKNTVPKPSSHLPPSGKNCSSPHPPHFLIVVPSRYHPVKIILEINCVMELDIRFGLFYRSWECCKFRNCTRRVFLWSSKHLAFLRTLQIEKL